MNKNNERLMAFIMSLRKMPRWVLIMITLGVIIVLGIAMFLLLPQEYLTKDSSTYINSTGLAFSVFLKLGVVVLLIIGFAIVLKRWQTKTFSAKSKQINVIETTHLTTHRTLYLVEIDGQKMLIGATDQSMTNLYQTLSSDFDILSPSAPDQKFSDLLDRANKITQK